MSIEMTPEIFTADYTGEPGQRTFFLQARSSVDVYSFMLEKQQVQVLAEKLKEMLVLIDQGDTIKSSLPERDPALALEEPVEPQWHVGTIGLAYDEGADRVLLLLHPAAEEPEEENEVEDDDAFRLLLRRDQVRTFALHAEAVLGEGRPICQLCGLPMDPEGHACPASNGHRMGG
jgi:uncharacterized repeat protein (TIGR03847 family)